MCPHPSLFVSWCSCGSRLVTKGEMCLPCYGKRQNSLRRFGGLRESVLERDGHRCKLCFSQQVIVHHRRSEDTLDALITLCAGCHARIHRTKFPSRLLSAAEWELWAEVRGSLPVQFQLFY